MGRDTCYFDGYCGMCRRSTRLLQRLDWLGRLAFVDMLSVPQDQLPVRIEQAMQGMPMRTAAGALLVGFPAVRRAAIQTPLGAIPAAFLYIPGLSHLGARIYQAIADRRSRSATCGVRGPDPATGRVV
jgi:predicted DCC family thiol-disulfide oxidoreductase YuxK